MCEFCTFEYGIAKSSIKKKEVNKSFIWEIRPNTSGKYMMLVRVLSDKEKNNIAKSVIFIEYCPLCGRKL